MLLMEEDQGMENDMDLYQSQQTRLEVLCKHILRHTVHHATAEISL